VDAPASRGRARAALTELERAGLGAGLFTPVEVLAPAGSAPRAERALARLPGVAGVVRPRAWRRDGGVLFTVPALVSLFGEANWWLPRRRRPVG
jgi:hypothetical protein